MDPYGEGVLAAIAGVGNKELPNDSFVRMMEAKGMNATGGVRSDKPMQEGSDEQRCAAYLGCLKAISAIDTAVKPTYSMTYHLDAFLKASDAAGERMGGGTGKTTATAWARTQLPGYAGAKRTPLVAATGFKPSR